MIKNITMIIICFMSLSLSASEKKQKDVYTLDELKTEVSRIRNQYKQDNHSFFKDITTRGNRINYEPINQQPNNQAENHT